MNGLLALRFDIYLSGGHTNNFLVQNVTRALVDKLVVKFAGTILQDTVGYDIYKTFEDLFLPGEKRNNIVHEGIQSEDLCKFSSGAGDKKDSEVAAENKLTEVYGSKYCIRLDHEVPSSINLWSLADKAMHGSDTRLVSTKDGVQLEIGRGAKGTAS